MSYWKMMEYADPNDPTEAGRPRDILSIRLSTAWGFVIVRCTYSSQEKWEKWLKTFQAIAHFQLEVTKANESLRSKLAWTVVEDFELNNADRFQARDAFVEWLSENKLLETSIADFQEHPEYAITTRHRFFVYVGEDALESVRSKP